MTDPMNQSEHQEASTESAVAAAEKESLRPVSPFNAAPPFLSPSEAILGLAVWLASRNQRITVSAFDDGAPLMRLCEKFIDANELGEPRAGWGRNLVQPDGALPPLRSVALNDSGTINELAARIHKANHKWWHDKEGVPLERNRGELLMLIVSEVSEAMEGERCSLMDTKLPHRPMAEVELADAMIRILDYAAGFGYDIGGALVEKMAYNAVRKDHTHEEREKANGKKW